MPFIYKLSKEQEQEIRDKIHDAIVAVIDEYGLFEIEGVLRVYHHRSSIEADIKIAI